MTLTETRRKLIPTQSDQLDEAQDSWKRAIRTNLSENKQVLPYELEFALNPENVSRGKITVTVQYQNCDLPSFEETPSSFVKLHTIPKSGECAYRFFRTALDARAKTHCEQSSKVLLDKLLDMGFAWIHIAKMIHVPVYIVRDLDFAKDDCEDLDKEPHGKLAQLLTLIKLLEERFPNRNIPSWLETTLDGYYYSGIDVIAKDQIELLVRYAYGEISNTEVLNKCFPNWEDNFDSRIEVFTASDGEKAIRLRADNLED